MSGLRVTDLRVMADGRTLVDGISFAVAPGEIVAMIGPNGAGKSQSLRGALGLVTASGTAELDGQSLWQMRPAARARALAYLPQQTALAWSVRVRDVVALGRFAYGAAPARLSGADLAAVDAALAECGLQAFETRSVDTLSGGELARVHCARAFCAQTPLLIADEPVAALDPAQAFRVMDLLRAKADAGLGVLVVLHDIALAARYADRLVMLKDGRVMAQGPVETVLTADTLQTLYGIKADVQGRDVVLRGRDEALG